MPWPAYRLRTPRLELHAADPVRALAFLQATRASLDSLRPWMDWAHDLPDEDGIVELMRAWRAQFDGDRDRHYHVCERDTGEVIGAVGVHPRVKGRARELGYWMRADRQGRGLMTEAVGGVVRAEMTGMGHDRLDIYVETNNLASQRVARKLGFDRVGTLPGHIAWSHGPDRDAVLFCLLRDAWQRHPLRSAAVEAWDVVDRPLSLD